MATALLALVGSALLFYHLGKTDFCEDSAARIAVYARQMNADNHWLAPLLRGQPRIDVPPLYLWSVKLSSLLSPEVTVMDTRVPSAVCGMLLALLVAWWLYRHLVRYGREDVVDAPPEGFALLVGLIVVSSPVLLTLGREGTVHTMFNLLYLAAAFCMSESFEARRSFYAGWPWRGWVLWGYALAGLAMLVNGPLVLLLVGIPYVLAARSYHLRGLDRVHLLGLALAFAIGGSWPLAVGHHYPALASSLWRQWLTFHLGKQFMNPTDAYHYLLRLVAAGFPWIILAGVMAVRVWRKLDRSPTLVFWMCSLLGNLVLLTATSDFIGRHLLPVMIFMLLLAGDGLYRWNFETRWATAWRVLLRIVLGLAFVGGMVISLLLSSFFGLTLFILLPIIWILWAIQTHRRGLHFTPWEATLRLSAMTVLLIVAAEAVVLSNWEPRRVILNDTLTYFRRIRARLADREDPMFLQHGAMSMLYDYYLGVQPLLKLGVGEPRVEPGHDTFLFADRDIASMTRNPRLDPLTFNWGTRREAPTEGMFRVLPAADRGTSASQRSPLRVALLGGTGAHTGAQRDVARQVGKVAGARPIDDALLLGNNISTSASPFEQLNFIKCFELPYGRLLKSGVVFHAALGPADEGYAWAQMRYPPFHMQKRRYYNQELGGGLVDLFMLDGEALYDPATKKFDEEQLKWLEQELAESKPPWRVVGLSQALLTAAQNGRIEPPLTGRLLPLLDRYHVDLVAWAGGRWYERFELPGHRTVFVNAGWSGGARGAGFKPDARLKFGFDRKPGFVMAEFRAAEAKVQAVTAQGLVIDQALLRKAAAAGSGPR